MSSGGYITVWPWATAPEEYKQLSNTPNQEYVAYVPYELRDEFSKVINLQVSHIQSHIFSNGDSIQIGGNN